MRIKVAILAILATQATFITAQMNSSPPDTDFFLPVENVGSEVTGTDVPFYGCIDNGATLQRLSVYANDQWIRGLEATLTDGRGVQAGCLNVDGNSTTPSGCTDTGIRNSNFTFQGGETIVNLTLYPGYDVEGQAYQRAGGLNITTSMGRYFSFGMTYPWSNGTSIDVGTGIPCGIAPKAGADVDSLAFVFLRSITVSALQNVQYSGISSGSQGDVSLDVAPLQESAVQLVLINQTYNNSGNTTSLVASISSQAALPTSSRWTAALGLDSYLQAPVNGTVPQIIDYSTNTNASWNLDNSGLHSRSESSENEQSYNYTITVGPHGVSQITATAVQGNVTATYSATLNATVDSGSSFSIPVQGLYFGVSTSPEHINVQELVPAAQSGNSTSSTSTGGLSNTVAWVVGVLVGLVCGLLLAALLAWAVVLIMRKRNKMAQSGGDRQDQTSPKSRGCLPYVQIPAFFGKSKGVEPESIHKDIELGAASGKGKWLVEDQDLKLPQSQVYGIPVKGSPKAAEKQVPLKSSPEERALSEEEEEGKHVLPYNMFRRLRLNSIRQNLKLDTPDRTPVSPGQAQPDKTEGGDNLSNPPSEASTPRTIPEMSRSNERASISSETGAESIDGLFVPESEQGSKSNGLDDEKVALDLGRQERDEQPLASVLADSQRQKMKTQVVQRMAQRRLPSPERPSHSTQPSQSTSNPLSTASKVTLMDKISGQIANYRSQPRLKTPGGLTKEELHDNAITHGDQTLKLGAGYKTVGTSRDLEKDTVQHDDERIKLGVKYDTQGRNE